MDQAFGTPKYSQPEIERRWLMSAFAAEALITPLAHRLIEDPYIVGTRLRLRKVTGQSVEFKLGKKYGPSAAGVEQVVSVYLAEEEYNALAALPAHVALKRRHAFARGSIDQYVQPSAGLFIFEVEFPSLLEASAFVPPSFVETEVTGNPGYSGFAIAAFHA